MPDPRQRRRVQLRRQPGRLLPPADRHRHRHGRLSHRRSDRRARAGDGREALLQALQARRRQRPEHGHRLQRPRPGRARPGGVLQPLQRSRRAAEARRFRLEDDLRGRRALVPQRRHFRRPLGDHRRSDHRRHAGRQGRRRRRLVRPELPRQALEHLRRRTTAPSPCSTASSRTWTCWSATKRTCRRAWAFPGPKWRPNPSSTPAPSSA